jgi:hypothetical protein
MGHFLDGICVAAVSEVIYITFITIHSSISNEKRPLSCMCHADMKMLIVMMNVMSNNRHLTWKSVKSIGYS